MPGRAIENDHIELYLGSLPNEGEIKSKVLAANGITSRHYAQDKNQEATYSVYDLAIEAIANCLGSDDDMLSSYLAIGTTCAPLVAPGIASIVHGKLIEKTKLRLAKELEVNSFSGICTSGASAITGAIRAVTSKAHESAICVGVEHASEILKANVIKTVDDRDLHIGDLRRSQWFMSIFLRFMLSDGAGAMVIGSKPATNKISYRIDWCYSRSFASEAPICMKLDAKTRLLTQDVTILNKFLIPTSKRFISEALSKHNEVLDSYSTILPHMSSFIFQNRMQKVIKELLQNKSQLPQIWTNLKTVGNTGAASIFIMLDEFINTQKVSEGEKLLLFIPESGQFNYVCISLTAVNGKLSEQ